MANSYEYDESGHTTEEAGSRVAMVERRLRKCEAIQKEAKAPSVYGDEHAEITFVTWGSTKGPLLEAVTLLSRSGKKARVVHLPWLFPFPTEAVKTILSREGRLVAVEQNATGQLASLIQEHTGILIKEKFLKYDGRPWYPEEVVERVAS